jgi:hypothetical protein
VCPPAPGLGTNAGAVACGCAPALGARPPAPSDRAAVDRHCGSASSESCSASSASAASYSHRPTRAALSLPFASTLDQPQAPVGQDHGQVALYRQKRRGRPNSRPQRCETANVRRGHPQVHGAQGRGYRMTGLRRGVMGARRLQTLQPALNARAQTSTAATHACVVQMLPAAAARTRGRAPSTAAVGRARPRRAVARAAAHGAAASLVPPVLPAGCRAARRRPRTAARAAVVSRGPRPRWPLPPLPRQPAGRPVIPCQTAVP